MSTAFESVVVDVDGLSIVGDRRHSDGASGAPIILLHGGGQTRHSWDRSAIALAERGRSVYTFDLRGHGDSGWAPDGQYGLDGFVGDLRRVLASIGGDAPVLVGASLGGITSLCVAGEFPGSASALVMVDVVVDVERKGIERIRAFMSDHLDGFDTLEDVADAVAAYTPGRTRTRNLDGLRKNVRQREDGRWYWHWDPAFMRSDGDEPRVTDPTRLRAAACGVDVPTLIVHGGKSDVVSQAGVESMKALVPHAEVADVAAAGHMVAGDDNQVFESAIESFLIRHGL